TDLGGPAVDRTGLDGVFDFTLTSREQSVSPTSATTLEDGPSVFTALQEQLGLKLEAQRAPVDVLVIDRVERPKPE
ncbi:MAG TPA: TIGR03435 family protein, partial [Vicinamibacterales bacterium]|nr:TIGR03435 family protein [Vicinamibacterales bacterium]